MAIKQTSEIVVQTTAGNIIFETTQTYIPNSVSMKYIINDTSEIDVAGVVEIGGTYVQLSQAPTIGTKIRIYYDVRTSDSLDVDILQRLRALEEQVNKQNKMLDILTQALDNRVDKHTFRVWIKAMEQSYGKPVLDQTLLGIQAVHQSSNN